MGLMDGLSDVVVLKHCGTAANLEWDLKTA